MTRTLREARLRQRLRRHGWSLQRKQQDGPYGRRRFRVVDASDGTVVVGDAFDLDLDDVAAWLE